MRLATYALGDGTEGFGVIVGDHVVAFDALADGSRARDDGLESMDGYLRGLPGTRDRAGALLGDAAAAVAGGDAHPLAEIELRPPVPHPAALLDCGLTPRHLASSSATLLRRSLPPGIGHLAGAVARLLLGRVQGSVRYYKGNCRSLSGDGDTIKWPDFTAYLDIEPELAIVTGAVPIGADPAAAREAIAGYTIFNDVSARDVQLAEMFFSGPATSKDLDTGNGFGPWLVTPDEIGDPRDLDVTVEIDGREPWTGTTAEYSMDPVDVVVALAERQSLAAGTLIGMGTVPGTCGLDRDEWLAPGAAIAITFAGIGTLHQHLGIPIGNPRTRWAPRRLAPLRRGA